MNDRRAIARAVALCTLLAGVPARAVAEDAPAPARPTDPPSLLTRLWDLDRSQGKLRFSGYRPMYFLPGRVTSAVHDAPFRETETGGEARTPRIQSVEAKFQISLKWKFAERILRDRADLWIGYTQQSHWQIWNSAESRPFRETNYEPELMLVFPARFRFLGMDGRFVRAGVVHQSNGRSEPLSRSWNRIDGQVGLERGNFSLLVRPWWRIDGGGPGDDNPGIERFAGRLEVAGIHQHGEHTFVWTAKTNLDFDPLRGSLQAEWIVPFQSNLRGYVQAFTGYGESLIDFDHRQTTIGVGFLIFGWL